MISKRVRLGGLPTLWFVTVILMVRDSVVDSHQTGYGHNNEAAFGPTLWTGLAVTLGELAVVYLVLRPWSVSVTP